VTIGVVTAQESTTACPTATTASEPAAPAPLSKLVLVPAAVTVAVLLAFAGRYGYHGDEMYFIVAGGHPAFGYPDQPPLVPLLVWAMHGIWPSLYLVRLPSALAAGAVAVVAGATAREAGGGTRAQVIAACVAAVSGITLATGHFVTTTTFDVLSTATLGWLLVGATTRRDPRLLLWAGIVVGVGFEAKPQVGFVAALALVSFGLVGPRWVFRSRWLWAGLAAAAVLGLPYVIWQQRNGWPQFTVAGNIAGNAEDGRIGFIPFQIVMVSPLLVPVWIAGLVRAAGERALRFVPVLYGLVAVAYLVGDGKAYYLASLYPTLVGIGAVAVAGWFDRPVAAGPHRLRWATLTAAVALSALFSGLLALPVLPERKLPGSGAVAVNPDLAETVGWPQFIDAVATAWNTIPPAQRDQAVVFAFAYNQAGAIDLFGGRAGLPSAYSAHNGFWLWGPPPDDRTTTIVIGYDSPASVAMWFTGCVVVDRVTNPWHLENSQYGEPVMRCSALTAPWSRLWPHMRHYQ
jgi:4-amino-4-deoxy-L-arabinose transferase-like glycosyltransferase